jgi:hypothetical protein
LWHSFTICLPIVSWMLRFINNGGHVQFLGELLEGGLLGLIHHNFHHLLADELLLGAGSVASGADLSAGSLGEANAEHAEEVPVDGLALDEGLNGGVPLLDDGAQLVASDVHAVEVGVAVEALDFLDLHLHLSPSLFVAISVQISQRYLKHTPFQAVSSDLYSIRYYYHIDNHEVLTLTSSSVAGCDGGCANVENGGHVDVVPLLLLESVSAIKWYYI